MATEVASNQRARAAARRRRRSAATARLWIVTFLVVAGSAVLWLNTRPGKDGKPVLSLTTAPPSFETLRDEWAKLSEQWRAERSRAEKIDPFGGTDRDHDRNRDAFRILNNVAGRLESLRRAEARKERSDWVREELGRDRLEWDALVASVQPSMPTEQPKKER
ncbi:MAG: hypothetical protein WAT39_19520 [Planctomycetota bacterium]